MSEKTLNELLLMLYDCYWNGGAAFDSHVKGYSLIADADVVRLDEICEAIEERLAAGG